MARKMRCGAWVRGRHTFQGKRGIGSTKMCHGFAIGDVGRYEDEPTWWAQLVTRNGRVRLGSDYDNEREAREAVNEYLRNMRRSTR